MATNFDGVACDYVIETQNKNKRKNNENDDVNTKKALTFRLFGEGKYPDATNDSLVHKTLQNMPMHHATERQGSSEWFKSRAFSFASYGVDIQFTLSIEILLKITPSTIAIIG